MPVQIEKTDYCGWRNSYRISNGTVEVVITSDIGPRVMRYGFAGGGQNLFKEFEEQLGKSGEPDWQARGGHRLWVAPEDVVKSYAPDNRPVQVETGVDFVTATAPVEPLTGLEKKITVRMEATGSGVQVTHELRNAGDAPCDVAPWALTMMAQGGTGIHGFPPRGTHPEMLAPSNPLVVWPFTDLRDGRWGLLRKYLVLHQDPCSSVPQKLGSFNPRTWGAYLLKGELFVKRYEATAPASAYPDMGCSYETFTNADMLELETLGPLTRLTPGATVSHVERWNLYRDVFLAFWDDSELDRVILPLALER